MRGTRLRLAVMPGCYGRLLAGPRWRLISAGIAALAAGFVLGLKAELPGAVVSEAVRPASADVAVSVASQVPDSQGYRLASLETKFLPASLVEDDASRENAGQSVVFEARGASFNERFFGDPRVPSFDERWTSTGLPGNLLTATVDERANETRRPRPDMTARAAARPSVKLPTPGPVRLASLTPSNISKESLRATDAPADSDSTPDADDHTAIYDITAHMVYLPDGSRLEAHSGIGPLLDNPRYVSAKDRGPTPPNVYDLSLREELFHGVRALRLTPVGDGKMYGRDGILAHTYMLGPNGQSNGCVSFSNYEPFLRAYQSGEVTRLIVVEHLANAPGPRTASDWIPRTIKALFGRS